jgi:predicted ATPase
MISTRLFVITGGPGSGKTTLLDALAAAGFSTVPESGRAIIRAQVAIGGTALHWQDRSTFAELMLDREIRSHEVHAGQEGPIFFDRGVPDLVGYARLCGLEGKDHFRRAAKLYRYDDPIFLAPPWRDIYARDSERGQDWDEAVRTFEAMRDAYAGCGYRTVELPLTAVEERVAFVLERSGNTR